MLGALWAFSDSDAERAHDDAWALWASKEPTAYSFDYSYCGGMCSRCWLRVSVTNGGVTDAVGRGGTCSMPDARSAPTTECIFAMVAADRSAEITDSAEVTYDPTWGFPASVSIRCPDGWADCGSRYEVTNFRVQP